MSAGDHSIPFEAKLPLELPSTFDGQRGCVHYEARLVVEGLIEVTAASEESDDEGETRVRAKKSFTVFNGLDLSFIPEAAVSRMFTDIVK